MLLDFINIDTGAEYAEKRYSFFLMYDSDTQIAEWVFNPASSIMSTEEQNQYEETGNVKVGVGYHNEELGQYHITLNSLVDCCIIYTPPNEIEHITIPIHHQIGGTYHGVMGAGFSSAGENIKDINSAIKLANNKSTLVQILKNNLKEDHD